MGKKYFTFYCLGILLSDCTNNTLKSTKKQEKKLFSCYPGHQIIVMRDTLGSLICGSSPKDYMFMFMG